MTADADVAFKLRRQCQLGLDLALDLHAVAVSELGPEPALGLLRGVELRHRARDHVEGDRREILQALPDVDPVDLELGAGRKRNRF